MDALRFSAVLLILAMACFMTESTGVCDKDKVEGTGNLNLTRYFFDSDTETCETFIYRGGNSDTFPNRFNYHSVCENTCQCKLRKDTGHGEAPRTRWYHSSDGSGCQSFQYLGSGGNANNFHTESECEMACEL
uniref:Conotoxin n=1 Tax=Conus betulinus TaxID=89764 RepID=A0A142C1I3_CONBE|nr:conotoxin [Conus betulinus]